MKRKIIRRLDETGRLVIPKAFREPLDIKNGDYLELELCDGYISVAKQGDACVFCGNAVEAEYMTKPLCKKCIENIKKIEK